MLARPSHRTAGREETRAPGADAAGGQENPALDDQLLENCGSSGRDRGSERGGTKIAWTLEPSGSRASTQVDAWTTRNPAARRYARIRAGTGSSASRITGPAALEPPLPLRRTRRPARWTMTSVTDGSIKRNRSGFPHRKKKPDAVIGNLCSRSPARRSLAGRMAPRSAQYGGHRSSRYAHKPVPLGPAGRGRRGRARRPRSELVRGARERTTAKRPGSRGYLGDHRWVLQRTVPRNRSNARPIRRGATSAVSGRRPTAPSKREDDQRITFDNPTDVAR
jgi:hypothetical protein